MNHEMLLFSMRLVIWMNNIFKLLCHYQQNEKKTCFKIYQSIQDDMPRFPGIKLPVQAAGSNDHR